MIRTIAIVDAYSSANLLAPLFQKRGVVCVHVQSSPEIPEVYHHSFRKDDFTSNIIHHEDIEETLQQLKKAQVDQVIVGIESGVELADQLSERMACLTNGTALSEARRHKYKMVKALQSNGINTISSFLTADIKGAIDWIDNKYPVVCKPTKSAGTDDVIVCNDPIGVYEAFSRILGKKNKLNLVNDKVLVQEFISGTEHIVDVVVFENTVIPVGIYEYKKKLHCGSMIYDTVRILPFEYPAPPVLLEYARQVVRALGIRFGPAHLEIMMTTSGPVLVEIGARIDGAGAPILQKASTGKDQAELTVECYLEPSKFQARKDHGYQVQKHLLRVKLISDVEGVFGGLRFFNEIKALRSYFQFTEIVKPGQILSKTTNLFNCPGIVDLLHQDERVLFEDYRQIREWEKTGMYIFKDGSFAQSSQSIFPRTANSPMTISNCEVYQ